MVTCGCKRCELRVLLVLRVLHGLRRRHCGALLDECEPALHTNRHYFRHVGQIVGATCTHMNWEREVTYVNTRSRKGGQDDEMS